MNVNLDKFSAGPEGSTGGAAPTPAVQVYEYATYLLMVGDVGNRTAGDRAQLATGLTYEKVTDNWVPQYVVDRGTSPAVFGVIKGDVTPENEPIPWSDTKGGGTATITSDGTKVTWVSGGHSCYSLIANTETAGGVRWFDGLMNWVSATSISSAGKAMITIRDGAKYGLAAIAQQTDPFRWAFYADWNDTNPPPADFSLPKADQPDLTVEHHFQMIMDANAGVMTIRVNGLLVASLAYAAATGVASKDCVLPDISTGAFTLEGREIVYGIG